MFDLAFENKIEVAVASHPSILTIPDDLEVGLLVRVSIYSVKLTWFLSRNTRNCLPCRFLLTRVPLMISFHQQHLHSRTIFWAVECLHRGINASIGKAVSMALRLEEIWTIHLSRLGRRAHSRKRWNGFTSFKMYRRNISLNCSRECFLVFHCAKDLTWISGLRLVSVGVGLALVSLCAGTSALAAAGGAGTGLGLALTVWWSKWQCGVVVRSKAGRTEGQKLHLRTARQAREQVFIVFFFEPPFFTQPKIKLFYLFVLHYIQCFMVPWHTKSMIFVQCFGIHCNIYYSTSQPRKMNSKAVRYKLQWIFLFTLSATGWAVLDTVATRCMT